VPEDADPLVEAAHGVVVVVALESRAQLLDQPQALVLRRDGPEGAEIIMQAEGIPDSLRSIRTTTACDMARQWRGRRHTPLNQL
jgi:hypothetical protein